MDLRLSEVRGFENNFLKFKNFPGFPGHVQTLYINSCLTIWQLQNIQRDHQVALTKNSTERPLKNRTILLHPEKRYYNLKIHIYQISFNNMVWSIWQVPSFLFTQPASGHFTPSWGQGGGESRILESGVRTWWTDPKTSKTQHKRTVIFVAKA